MHPGFDAFSAVQASSIQEAVRLPYLRDRSGGLGSTYCDFELFFG